MTGSQPVNTLDFKTITNKKFLKAKHLEAILLLSLLQLECAKRGSVVFPIKDAGTFEFGKRFADRKGNPETIRALAFLCDAKLESFTFPITFDIIFTYYAQLRTFVTCRVRAEAGWFKVRAPFYKKLRT